MERLQSNSWPRPCRLVWSWRIQCSRSSWSRRLVWPPVPSYSQITVFPTNGNEPFSVHIVPGWVPAEVCEWRAARWRSPPPGLLSAHPGAALCLPDAQEPPQTSHRQVSHSLCLYWICHVFIENSSSCNNNILADPQKRKTRKESKYDKSTRRWESLLKWSHHSPSIKLSQVLYVVAVHSYKLSSSLRVLPHVYF